MKREELSDMNKSTYSYYKTSYIANRKYREKIGRDDYAEMLSKSEFEELREAGLSTQDIVYNQFHFYEKATAKNIQKSLLQEGFKVSMKNIQARRYSPEIYNKIKDTYHNLRATMSAAAAANLISYTYYGS